LKVWAKPQTCSGQVISLWDEYTWAEVRGAERV
jgi:hypothetical protein